MIKAKMEQFDHNGRILKRKVVNCWVANAEKPPVLCVSLPDLENGDGQQLLIPMEGIFKATIGRLKQ